MTQVDPGGLLKLLEQHLNWYPLMEPTDVYKLLYQGVMGSKHLLISKEEYTRFLHDEFEHLLPDSRQRLLEPVRPDQALFRLNLRPYKSRRLGLDKLTSSLIETGQLTLGTIAELRAAWADFVRLCQQGRMRHFNINLVHQFSQWLEEMEYPSMHHSEVYQREYQPAYRLISARFIPAMELADAS
jgi:hypothetical protein